MIPNLRRMDSPVLEVPLHDPGSSVFILFFCLLFLLLLLWLLIDDSNLPRNCDPLGPMRTTVFEPSCLPWKCRGCLSACSEPPGNGGVRFRVISSRCHTVHELVSYKALIHRASNKDLPNKELAAAWKEHVICRSSGAGAVGLAARTKSASELAEGKCRHLWTTWCFTTMSG